MDERGKPAPGGEPQEPAIGGGSPCPVPKTSLPASTCATSNGGKFPYIDFRSASAVANSGLTLFATQTADHIAAVAWQPIADTGQTFTRWACFDYVPHIHRIAAHEHADGTEVLATTVDGKLYARFSPHGPWTDWARLAGPYQDSCILDVTAPRTNDGNNYRFVNDHGVIFEMHLEGDSFDTFSSWEQVGVSGGSRIAATDIDGHKCVVALDADGLPELACTVEPEPGSPFADLEALGQARPVLQGIAAGVLPTGEAQAFGVDREGALWRLRPLASHWESTWESTGTSSGSERIIDVSTAMLRDDTFAILGVTAAGLVLRRANTSGSFWQPLAM